MLSGICCLETCADKEWTESFIVLLFLKYIGTNRLRPIDEKVVFEPYVGLPLEIHYINVLVGEKFCGLFD